MNWKLFGSTFLLIFLAELGDKTQLAAMATTINSGSARWTIFVAASSALVVSTLIAVLFGSVLTKVMPEGYMNYIKVAAGILFLVFGALILRESVGQLRKAAKVKPGLARSMVFRMAAEFEKAASEDYRALAARTQHAGLKALLESLAQEEEEHVRRLAGVEAEPAAIQIAEVVPALPPREQLVHDVAAEDRPILDHAIEHEKATAGFYEELARLTPVHSLRAAFQALASAEREHVRKLETFNA